MTETPVLPVIVSRLVSLFDEYFLEMIRRAERCETRAQTKRQLMKKVCASANKAAKYLSLKV